MSATCSPFPQLDFLADLPVEEQRAIAMASELRRFRHGQRVFAFGEFMHGLFVICQGQVKVFRSAGRGRTQILELLGPGDCLGEATAFGPTRTPAAGEAYGAVEGWMIPSAVLQCLLRDHPQVAEFLIRRIQAKLERMADLVESLSLHNVPERVARLLMKAHEANPGRPLVEFRDTQQELADRVGASREAFSRALRFLSERGLVQNTFPVVRLVNVDSLRRMAHA